MELLDKIEDSAIGENVVSLESRVGSHLFLLDSTAEFPLIKFLDKKGYLIVDYESLYAKREGLIFDQSIEEFKPVEIQELQEETYKGRVGKKIVVLKAEERREIKVPLFSMGESWNEKRDIKKFGNFKYVGYNESLERVRIHQAWHWRPLSLENIDWARGFLSTHLKLKYGPGAYPVNFRGEYDPIMYSNIPERDKNRATRFLKELTQLSDEERASFSLLLDNAHRLPANDFFGQYTEIFRFLPSVKRYVTENMDDLLHAMDLYHEEIG